jgi:hypothetical protein
LKWRHERSVDLALKVWDKPDLGATKSLLRPPDDVIYRPDSQETNENDDSVEKSLHATPP